MILFILTFIITLLIALYFFYRRPLKYTVDINASCCKQYKDIARDLLHKVDVFKKFPVFYSVMRNASCQSGKYITSERTACYQSGDVINETGIVKSGKIGIFYKQKLIAVKKDGSLIFKHGIFDMHNIQAIAMEESSMHIVVHNVNNHIYFLLLKKMHINLYSNLFKQTHILHKYEIEHFECKNIVTKQNTRDLIQFMTSLRLYENPFETAIKQKPVLESTDMMSLSKHEIFNPIKGRIREALSNMLNFKIPDSKKLSFEEKLQLHHLKFDEILCSSDFYFDKIIVVLHGKLIVDYIYQENHIFLTKNCVFGYFNAVFNLHEGFVIKAKENTLIYTLDIDSLKKYGFKPELTNMNFIKSLDPLLSLIDQAAEWIRLEPGQVLEDIANPSEHLYYIDDGLMKSRILNEENSHESKNIDYSTGFSFGKRELITQEQINGKYYATKTTDIIKIHKNIILHAMEKCPTFCFEYTKTILIEPKINKSKTAAIILSDERMQSFPLRFKEILPKSTLFLTYKQITTFLGSNMFDTLGELRFMDFIKMSQKKHELIIILLENSYTGLAKNIVNFCDVLLLIGHVEIKERLYCSVELVHLYQNREDIGGKVNVFFQGKSPYKNRAMNSKSHSQINKQGFSPKLPNKGDVYTTDDKEFKEKNESGLFKYNKVHHVLSPSKSHFCTRDFERLCRSLMGKRVGLVLSGGGARGIAHIGIIQALEEEGIPIDVIGGTSMGAFIGGLYARKCDNISVFRDVKKFCVRMTSKWRQILDLTYPVCSLFTGYAFNRIISGIFKDIMIEGLWIEYFCVTTNITTFEEMIHKKGLLWRYVRASMSLAGYLPPLCDPDGNNSFNLLLDGGYVNNVPTDAMLNMGVNKIIAIDVGSSVINNHYDYGDSLNGFVALFNRFFKNRKYLTVNEIQYRLAYITTQKKIRFISDKKIILLRPDIDDYKTLDFGKFEEIVACGYSYGRRMINSWKSNDDYKELMGLKTKTTRRYSI